MGVDNAQIRDQLGKDPDIFQVLNADHDESIGIEEGSTVISEDNIGHSFILGHPVNGILGIANGMDGQQILMGSNGRSTVIHTIVNPNRVFHEHFRDITFKSTNEPNTADWNITSYKLAMSSSSSHARVYNTVATSGKVAFNDGTVYKVTISCTETKYGNDLIKYYVRTGTSVDWEECTKGIQKTLTNPGTSLYFRTVFLGNGGSSTYIEDLDIDYE